MNLFTVIIFILATGFCVAFILKFFFSDEHNWMDPQTIREADAIILRIELRSSADQYKSRIRFQMQVQPDKGRNFVAEMEEPVTHYNISSLRAGSIVKVQYNAQTRTLLHIIAA